MLANHRIWRIEAQNAAADNQVETTGTTDQADLHVADAGDRHRLLGQIEPAERHDHSSGGPTGAPDSAKKAFQRLVKMLFNVIPGRLRSSLRKLPVPQTVNHPGERMPLPLSDDERIAVFWKQSAGAGGRAKFQPPARQAFCRGTDPATAENPQADWRVWMDLQIVHQAIHRAQAIAETARGGIPIGDRKFHVGNAGTAVLRFDLDAFAFAGRERIQFDFPAAGVLDQIGSQFSHGERDFFTFCWGKTDGSGKASGRSIRSFYIHRLRDLDGDRLRQSDYCKLLCHFRSVIFVPCPTTDWISNSFIRRLAPDSPIPRPSPVV